MPTTSKDKAILATEIFSHLYETMANYLKAEDKEIDNSFAAAVLIKKIHTILDNNQMIFNTSNPFSFANLKKFNPQHLGLWWLKNVGSYDNGGMGDILGLIPARIDNKQKVVPFLKAILAHNQDNFNQHLNDLNKLSGNNLSTGTITEFTALMNLYNLEAARRLAGGTFNYINFILNCANWADALKNDQKGLDHEAIKALTKDLFVDNNVLFAGSGKANDKSSLKTSHEKSQRYRATANIIVKLLASNKLPALLVPMRTALIKALHQAPFTTNLEDFGSHVKEYLQIDFDNSPNKISKRIAENATLTNELKQIKLDPIYQELHKAFADLMQARYAGAHESEDNLELQEVTALPKDFDMPFSADHLKDLEERAYIWLINKAASQGHSEQLENYAENKLTKNGEALLAAFKLVALKAQEEQFITAKEFVSSIRSIKAAASSIAILGKISFTPATNGKYFLENFGSYYPEKTFRKTIHNKSVEELFTDHVNDEIKDKLKNIFKLTSWKQVQAELETVSFFISDALIKKTIKSFSKSNAYKNKTTSDKTDLAKAHINPQIAGRIEEVWRLINIIERARNFGAMGVNLAILLDSLDKSTNKTTEILPIITRYNPMSIKDANSNTEALQAKISSIVNDMVEIKGTLGDFLEQAYKTHQMYYSEFSEKLSTYPLELTKSLYEFLYGGLAAEAGLIDRFAMLLSVGDKELGRSLEFHEKNLNLQTTYTKLDVFLSENNATGSKNNKVAGVKRSLSEFKEEGPNSTEPDSKRLKRSATVTNVTKYTFFGGNNTLPNTNKVEKMEIEEVNAATATATNNPGAVKPFI